MTKNKGSQRRKIMKVALIASDNNASSGAFLSMTNLAIQLNYFVGAPVRPRRYSQDCQIIKIISCKL